MLVQIPNNRRIFPDSAFPTAPQRGSFRPAFLDKPVRLEVSRSTSIYGCHSRYSGDLRSRITRNRHLAGEGRRLTWIGSLDIGAKARLRRNRSADYRGDELSHRCRPTGLAPILQFLPTHTIGGREPNGMHNLHRSSRSNRP